MKQDVKSSVTQLLGFVRKAIDEGAHAIAAFDADGTLWNDDVGEGFFKYQIENALVPLPKNPWEHYKDLKKNVSHEVAYLWLAQINKGRSISEVRRWAFENIEKNPPDFISESKQLVEGLKKWGVEIYVVTASIKWAVEPAAHLLGIDFDHVLGVKSKVLSGLVTEEQEGEITWKHGKAKALLAATHNRRPVIVSGNTLGDLDLIQLASHLKVSVMAAKPGSHMWDVEKKLRDQARGPGWHHLP